MLGITPSVCRAARALLGWSRQDLAEASRVSLPIIEAYEANTHACRWAIEQLLARAFEAAGIDVFTRDAWGGAGVCLRRRHRTLSLNGCAASEVFL